MQRGFTLIELIMVLVILAAVSVGISAFIRGGMQTYVDVTEREQLLSDSRFALERLTRELSSAVPNSVRIGGNATTHCIEFVPINWNTVYTSLPILPSTASEIDVVALHDIDNQPYAFPATTNYALVYPLRSSDVYDPANQKRLAVTGCSDDGDGDCATLDDSDKIVQLAISGGFAASSPAKRLYLVDHSVSYCVNNQQLLRFESVLSPSQPTLAGNAVVMAKHIANQLSANPATVPQSDDPFRYYAPSLQRNSVVQIRLRFEYNEELVAFQHEVHVPNVP